MRKRYEKITYRTLKAEIQALLDRPGVVPEAEERILLWLNERDGWSVAHSNISSKALGDYASKCLDCGRIIEVEDYEHLVVTEDETTFCDVCWDKNARAKGLIWPR